MEGKTQENGSGQGWDERASSAQVAEWPIAVGDETGALVAHSARPLRRSVVRTYWAGCRKTRTPVRWYC